MWSGMVYWMAHFTGLRFSVNEFGANGSYFGTPANWTTAMTPPRRGQLRQRVPALGAHPVSSKMSGYSVRCIKD